MSKQIIIEENKVLKLKNVLTKTFIIDENFDENAFNIKFKEFNDYILNNKIASFGPMIIKNQIIGTEKKLIQFKLMIQTKNESLKVAAPYGFEIEHKTKPCLFSQFIGNHQDQGYANLKMQVYAYENDLILDVESYQVTKNKDNEVEIDTFVPIIGRV